MITISNKPFDVATLNTEFPENSIERQILSKMSASNEKYTYDTLDQLKFELRLRKEIIKAAIELSKSKLSFSIFRKTKCNPDYWNRTDNGGFELKDSVKPSDAINDIFKNGSKYATECATALVIVYYEALLDIFGEESFNKTFPKIYLMNWHSIDQNLEEIGYIKDSKDFLPGDRRYFENPDVDPLKPEWQGENVIDLGNGLYYGHDIGNQKPDVIIKALNRIRKKDATQSAHLLDLVGRPNFKNLSNLYNKSHV